ncbi:transglutaminase-like domain-containing protein [Curvibacter sp. HBC61]|uniref:Transglutaminase-like domain-containing protein n=1 Tax=Curvibacter cyanobacteriorum TaxID=3026422 RepID=A0ABT5N2G1_9BURK|nr:transglutaminase-like domain-containing protein [Curvibacter sp. HBC61]MDD0840498.1 transglutaminase-like domain-containing protein [Curvibacter sp. HBC61]
MGFSFSLPTPLGYFSTLVQSDVHFPLLEAAASVAQDDEPELDVQQVLGDLDQLQARLGRRLKAGASSLQKLQTLNQFFYHDLGFGGNLNNYYDPDNSYLNAVLRTRRGIPVSLAILWLELAQGLGLKAQGVGFPGHFLIKVNLAGGQVVLDPINGQSLGKEALSERLEPFRHRSGLVDDFEAPLGLYLQATPPRDILARLLRNLKEIHRSQQDWARMVAVQDRLIVLQPQVWAEYRDRGLAHAEQGRDELAERDLKTYLEHAHDAVDLGLVAVRLAELRSARP